MLFNFEAPFAVPAPIAVDPTVGQVAVEVEKADPSPPLPPSQEDVRAADQFFECERESQMVAGLLGVWMSTALLHDLMIEHLGKHANEFEDEENKHATKNGLQPV